MDSDMSGPTCTTSPIPESVPGSVPESTPGFVAVQLPAAGLCTLTDSLPEAVPALA